MPLYDRKCESCDWCAIDVMEPVHVPTIACPKCGAPTVRAWLTKPPAAIGDEMDWTMNNGFKQPRRFRSKQERKRALKEAGWREDDSHHPMPGSDKGPNSTAWTSGGTQWLRDAEELARRNGTAKGNDPEPPEFNITWTEGTMTAAEVERYRNR